MALRHTLLGIFATARISVPTVVDSALGRLNVDECDARLAWWSKKLLEDARVHLVVHGREHAESNEPFIVMSNHQSLYDVPVLYRTIPGRMRMVTKAELFKVPIWGKAMEAAGFIRVDRGDRAQAVESLRSGSSLLQDGTRIWIAPEGTRSKTGALGAFKSGGFRMALETGTRILPVAIKGTRDVLPAEGYVVHRDKNVVVKILSPVDPRPFGMERRKDLATVIHDLIAGALHDAPSRNDAYGGVTTS
jgi:1-acyl-sn-glycerol-3-phosphate acyltransferase